MIVLANTPRGSGHQYKPDCVKVFTNMQNCIHILCHVFFRLLLIFREEARRLQNSERDWTL